MTEAEKLQKEIRDADNQAIARAEQLYKGYEEGDPYSERMVLYGVRCAHTLTTPNATSLAVARIYRDKHPELKEQRETLAYKRKKEEHQRKMLRTPSNLSGDATIARLQNSGGLARRSNQWVWTADRVYSYLLGKYGSDYADCWLDTYDKEKRRADEQGYSIELHPEGSIIIKKGKEER